MIEIPQTMKVLRLYIFHHRQNEVPVKTFFFFSEISGNSQSLGFPHKICILRPKPIEADDKQTVNLLTLLETHDDEMIKMHQIPNTYLHKFA